MNQTFSIIDYIVFFGYALLILCVGLFVSRNKHGIQKTTQEYFLADKSLPWWVIGATLICSNISAEQIIGMSGTGFKLGLAVASYEWMAALTLILVGKFLLPVYLKENIWTMPQFLQRRFDNRVRTTMAIFWLALYIFLNLTTVTYLGALTMHTVFGLPILYGILGLGLFACLYSIKGGLKAVAWTDVLQVIILISGGLLITYIGLNVVSAGQGVISGFKAVLAKAPEHFQMIIDKDTRPNDYLDVPGLSVLVGGLWITNLSYWGFNQYITQRAFAAKDLKEAQKGVVFAGYLKILVPFIVVIPGIIAYLCFESEYKGNNILDKSGKYSIINNMIWEKDSVNIIWGSKTLYTAPNDYKTVDINKFNNTPKSVLAMVEAKVVKPDRAYPALLAYLPSGIKGLAIAALFAAIVAALGSMINSISTIFTMDIYKEYINRNASEHKLVFTGRIFAILALIVSIPVSLMLQQVEQVFQVIQEFTGLLSPGVLVIFIAGFFWKRATSNAAMSTAIATIPIGIILKLLVPQLPFLDRMGIVFIVLCFIMILVSTLNSKTDSPKAINLEKGLFRTSFKFNITAIGIIIILAFLYTIFW
jgi:SSS family solute:Na+ symporter